MFDYESKGRVFESGIISVAATLGLALGRTLSVVQLALERNESHLGLAEHSFNLGQRHSPSKSDWRPAIAKRTDSSRNPALRCCTVHFLYMISALATNKSSNYVSPNQLSTRAPWRTQVP
jgi:hypothetical protein